MDTFYHSIADHELFACAGQSFTFGKREGSYPDGAIVGCLFAELMHALEKWMPEARPGLPASSSWATFRENFEEVVNRGLSQRIRFD